MTKADLVEKLYGLIGGLTKQEAADFLETLFATVKDTLASGESVKLSGFGTFVVRSKHQRLGRNPQTGTPMEISARTVVNFKPSQSLRDSINRV